MRLSTLAAFSFLSVLPFGSTWAQPVPSSQRVPNSWSAGTPVKIPTGGVKIDGMFFRASGPTAHPVLIYLHGLPGYSGDLDLPLPISRAGWNVLTLHYRGSWGSPGDYSYAHQVEDATAAIEPCPRLRQCPQLFHRCAPYRAGGPQHRWHDRHDDRRRNARP